MTTKMTEKTVTVAFGVLFAVSLLSTTCANAAEYRGFLELDDLTFDKIIKKFSAVLVKFDIVYPYGEKHETFCQFAEQSSVHIDDFLVATVGIKDYGDRENSKLAERFNVGTDFPVIKLFNNGSVSEWKDFQKDLSLEQLRVFVREHSSVYMVLKGCLEQYDKLALRFVDTLATTSAQSPETLAILTEAEEQLALLSEKDQNTAKVYIVIMKRIQEKGLDFVETEKRRQRLLLTGKLSDNKKIAVSQKINIMTAFETNIHQKSRTEL